MIRHLLLSTCLLLSVTLYSQNTVGVITNTTNAYNGYTLFTSHKQTYLINNCGEVINQWTSNYTPGNSVYLLENGNLLKTGSTPSTDIVFGGQGGVVELYSWEGLLIWQYFYDTPQYRQHHDVFPMPNGNILILAAKVLTNAEAIQAGRNPALLTEGVLYTEQIVEVQPVGSNQANIVWEWDMKNHLVQDFDASKSNYGVVSQNPSKLDINFTNGGTGVANWLHVNSVQYNATLDQIILSSRNLSEIWIIDHSTTTAEAATSTGGLYGKGGSILYRWGNPQAYDRGSESDRKLFGQHYPHWIPNELIDGGKLMVFNNGNGRQPQYSEVQILNPPTSAPGFYILEPNTTYGPETADYTYADNATTPANFSSHILSGADRLPNGNIFICEGINGRFFEIVQHENIVWQYINPVHNITGAVASQGSNPPLLRQLFRGIKYGADYPAFEGKDLTPGSPIELNSGANVACGTLGVLAPTLSDLRLSPNPTTGIVTINADTTFEKIEVYNLLGSKIMTVSGSKNVNLSDVASGVYLFKLFAGGDFITKKIIKQ